MPFQSKAAPILAFGNTKVAMPDISDSQFKWRSESECFSQLSDTWKNWLLDSGSLTQLLVEKSRGNFRVEVQSEGWTIVPQPAVRSRFGPLAAGHRFWSRKVVLLGNDIPWVLAHTLIPEVSLMSPLQRVLELNEKPLGEYLFCHPDLLRSGMDITHFAESSWGRRSLFYLFKKPVMVAEFFLPVILD